MKTKVPTAKNKEEEVCIWLDKYNDVFSDFDSRPLNNRVLSDDFLNEVRKMVYELPRKAKVALKFQLIDKRRDEHTEKVIIKSLRNHYSHNVDSIKDEVRETNRKGYYFAITGFLIICIPVILSGFGALPAISILHVMLEPVGWFMTWSGLDNLFRSSRATKMTLDFNEKMVGAKIIFLSYEADAKAQMITVHTLITDEGDEVRKETKMIPFWQ